MKLGLLLIALGLGYKVYADASKEKGNLKSLGQWVGAVIMAVSLLVSALMIYGYSSACMGGDWTFGKGGCPFTRQMVQDSAEKR
ncbi:MAG: hypothetical protein HYU34_04080 [Candidatus Omnitrophica bacterium]|nr:hypothetical protein [Candidatus Omnitrophota bacterium]